MTSRCKTCGKINYKSKRLAETAMRKMDVAGRLSTGGGGVPVAYRCDGAGQWHYGHSDTLSRATPGERRPAGENRGGKPDRWTRVEWDAATMTLWARARDSCELATCGKSLGNRVERHHRQRRQIGGDRLANLVLLHPECHEWAHAHPEEARELGVIVSAHAPDPAAVPLTLAGGERVLLDDDGTRRAAPPEDAPETDSM